MSQAVDNAIKSAYNRLVSTKRRGDVSRTSPGMAQRRIPVMLSYANTLLTLIASHLPGANEREAVARWLSGIPHSTLEDEQRQAVAEAEAVLKAGVR